VIVVRPTDTSQTYPLISWAHPWRGGSTTTEFVIGRIGADIASTGYIFVAHTSAAFNYCWTTDDQILTIDWIKNDATYSSYVDWTSQVGLLGYSMGAQQTIMSAANKAAVAYYNIGAAAALHPPHALP